MDPRPGEKVNEPAVAVFYDAVLSIIVARHTLRSLRESGALGKVPDHDRESLRRALERLQREADGR